MKISSVVLLAVFACTLQAQPRLSHAFRTAGEKGKNLRTTSPLKILAVMVQFKKDATSLTSGDGTFDLSTNAPRIIDAPPRDSSYFGDHLLFAQNYFNKSSKGRQILQTTVLGHVFDLSSQMQSYASVNGDLTPLARLAEDAWRAVDSVYQNFPFQNYDLFIVFHAGVGKDVDLRGSLGYDPTPYDLPSLYFNLGGFRKVLGPSYQGITLKNSSFIIQNTVILPETENRIFSTALGDAPLYLSINGLLVSNIASYLGLPDLFNTKTGRTAVGRFGLMDGQSIFSFNGIFPPSPSAWERMYLGWTIPIVVSPGVSTLRAPAIGLNATGNDTIYKIPISAKEYFLVENRNRDAKKDGQTLTMKYRGQEYKRTFFQDTAVFNYTATDSVFGVVTDADEFDWSLPGLIDNNNHFDGGLLIWHIDETIIEKNLASNSINADPNNRGVYPEEADGSQDIGQSYDLISPGSGSEDGSPLDYWFAGNKSPVYKNEFSERTNPNSLANSRARSHVAVNNFSASNSVMTFQANVGDASITLLKTFKRKNIKLNNNDASTAADLDGDGVPELIFTSGDSLYVFNNDLTPFLNNTTGLFSSIGGTYLPLFVKNFGVSFSADSNYRGLAGVSGSTVTLYRYTKSGPSADTVRSFRLSSPVTAPLCYRENDRAIIAGESAKRGTWLNSTATSLIVNRVDTLPEAPHVLVSAPASVNYYSSTKRTTPVPAEYFDFHSTIVRGAVEGRFAKSSVLSSAEGTSAVVVLDNNTFVLIPYGGSPIAYPVNDSLTGAVALADVDGDSQTDIVLGAGNGVYAFHSNGVLLDYFPLKVLDGGHVVGTPVVARLSGSNETAVIFGSSNGQLYAYTGKGKMIDGFPLQTGGIVSSPVLFNDKLAVASSDSSIYVWKTGALFDTARILWSTFLSDTYHSNFLENQSTPAARTTEFLPNSLAYNWPNPVYDGWTNIRYYLSKPASVKIRIFTMAGELVDELTGTGYANLDNEVRWNASKVQSGIYFAEIKASGSGSEKSVIIKIAVVK